MALTVMTGLCAPVASAQDRGSQEPTGVELPNPKTEVCDVRPVINKKSLKVRGYQVVEQVELSAFGNGWSAVLLSLALPEAETEALSAVSRLYILEGDRIEFDSFAFDSIEDSIEPSINTRTFFKMKWEVLYKGKTPSGLVLTGIVPRQASGEKVRVATRTLVLQWTPATSFRETADVVSREPARVSGGIMTVPVN